MTSQRKEDLIHLRPEPEVKGHLRSPRSGGADEDDGSDDNDDEDDDNGNERDVEDEVGEN